MFWGRQTPQPISALRTGTQGVLGRGCGETAARQTGFRLQRKGWTQGGVKSPQCSSGTIHRVAGVSQVNIAH